MLNIVSSVISIIILITVVLVYFYYESICIPQFQYMYYKAVVYLEYPRAFAFFRTLLHTIFSPGGIPAIAAIIFLIKKGGRPLWFSIVIAVIYFLDFFSSFFTIISFVAWAIIQCFWAFILFYIYKNIGSAKNTNTTDTLLDTLKSDYFRFLQSDKKGKTDDVEK